MNLNHPDKKPVLEDRILIATGEESDPEFTSGWYDLHEKEYYQYDGELIENLVGWMYKPEITIGEI